MNNPLEQKKYGYDDKKKELKVADNYSSRLKLVVDSVVKKTVGLDERNGCDKLMISEEEIQTISKKMGGNIEYKYSDNYPADSNKYHLKQSEIIQDLVGADLDLPVNNVKNESPIGADSCVRPNVEPMGATLAVAQSDDTSLTIESIVSDWTPDGSVETGSSCPNVEPKTWKSWFKNAGEQLKNVGQKIKNFFLVPQEEKLSEVENFNKDTAKDLKKQLAKENRQSRESYVKNSWVAKYPWLKEPLRRIENAKASVEGFAIGFLLPMVSRVVLHDPLLSQLAGGTTGMFLKYKLSHMYERAYYSYEDINQMVKEKLNQKNSVLSVAACSAFLAKLENNKKILGNKVDLAKFNRLKNQINRRLINQIVAAGGEGYGIKIMQDKFGNKIIQSSDLVSKLLKKEVDGMFFGMDAEGRKKFEARYSQGLFSGVMANVVTSVVGCASHNEQPKNETENNHNHYETEKDIKIPAPHSIFNRNTADSHPYDLQEKVNQSHQVISGNNPVGVDPGVCPTKETLAVAQPDNHVDVKPTETVVEHPAKIMSQQTDQTPGYHPFETNPNHVKHGAFGNGDNNQPGMGGVNKNQDTDYGNAESDQSTSDQKPVLHHSTEGKKNFDEFLNEKTEYSGSAKPVVDEKPIDASKLFHTEKGLKNFQENWGSHTEPVNNPSSTSTTPSAEKLEDYQPLTPVKTESLDGYQNLNTNTHPNQVKESDSINQYQWLNGEKPSGTEKLEDYIPLNPSNTQKIDDVNGYTPLNQPVNQDDINSYIPLTGNHAQEVKPESLDGYQKL